MKFINHTDAEPCILTMKILEMFRKDVNEYGAEFLIVHLPGLGELGPISKGRKNSWSDLVAEIDERFGVISPCDKMIEAVGDGPMESLLTGQYSVKGNQVVQGHYSLKGNEAIAETIAEYLSKMLESKRNEH